MALMAQAAKKKMYMLYDLEPDRSLTGGPWYSADYFEGEFIHALKHVGTGVRVCCSCIAKRCLRAAHDNAQGLEDPLERFFSSCVTGSYAAPIFLIATTILNALICSAPGARIHRKHEG